jgi:hypothetical protein
VIVTKLPPEVADRQRQKARDTAQRKGHTLSPRQLALLGWNIYITNVLVSMLTLQQVLVMYSVRWQVELIFKVWKSRCALDRVAGRRRERILTELYAKLIGVVVTHFLIASFRSVKRELSKSPAYCPTVCLALGPESRFTRTTHDRIRQADHPLPQVCAQRQAPEASEHLAQVANSKSMLA